MFGDVGIEQGVLVIHLGAIHDPFLEIQGSITELNGRRKFPRTRESTANSCF